MRKSFFFPALRAIAVLYCLFLVHACKKSNADNSGNNQNSEYYLRFKANGVKKEYTSQPAAIFTKVTSDGVYGGLFDAYKDYTAGVQDVVSIIIFSSNPVVANISYHDPLKTIKTDQTAVPQILLTYTDEHKNTFQSMGPIGDENGNTIFAGVVADAQVTITELTSTYIKGTFSGSTYLSTDISLQQKQAITEGEFYLKRLQ